MSFNLAGNTDGSGTYNLSGGMLTTTMEFVGDGGVGNFIQSGGTNAYQHGQLTLGTCSGSYGTYVLTGGSLSQMSETIGDGGIATFTQSGGTNTVSGGANLWVGSNAYAGPETGSGTV